MLAFLLDIQPNEEEGATIKISTTQTTYARIRQRESHGTHTCYDYTETLLTSNAQSYYYNKVKQHAD